MSGISIVPDITHDLSGRVAELEAENERLRGVLASIMDNWVDIMTSGEGEKYNRGYNQALLDATKALKGAVKEC